jgi:hypothetical protein
MTVAGAGVGGTGIGVGTGATVGTAGVWSQAMSTKQRRTKIYCFLNTIMKSPSMKPVTFSLSLLFHNAKIYFLELILL